MKEFMKKQINIEKIVRIGLIVLTFVSLLIVMLNFTYLIYSCNTYNIDKINAFLINYVNGPVVWIDNILLYLFAVAYIIIGIKSKKEVTLKISFSIFSILTTMIALTFIINFFAEMFGMF